MFAFFTRRTEQSNQQDFSMINVASRALFKTVARLMPGRGFRIIFLPLTDARPACETFWTRRCNAIHGEPRKPPVNLDDAPGFSCSSLATHVARSRTNTLPSDVSSTFFFVVGRVTDASRKLGFRVDQIRVKIRNISFHRKLKNFIIKFKHRTDSNNFLSFCFR